MSIDDRKNAPKVRTRRLTTSIRAGVMSSGGDTGGDGSTGDTSVACGTDRGGPAPSDGNYFTYGALSTWSCR